MVAGVGGDGPCVPFPPREEGFKNELQDKQPLLSKAGDYSRGGLETGFIIWQEMGGTIIPERMIDVHR